jgi:hypothetical protein
LAGKSHQYQKFDTEVQPRHISDGYSSHPSGLPLPAASGDDEEDDRLLRQQQMLLLQTENDEDEIIDLLGEDHPNQTYSSNAEALSSSHSIPKAKAGAQSQQKKPPVTGGSTQKNKKSISSGQKLFNTND